MHIAIIDCGTNTFNLLVAKVSPTGWQTVFHNKLPVKLGAGGFQEKVIVESRFYRGIDAILCHYQNIKNFNCDKVFAFATSAVREAKNGNEFVERVKKQFDINIEIIDGNREAELIYKGIAQTHTLGATPELIMDIGGGSTEFIIANNTGILWKKSYLLGVSRLFDKIKPSARLTQEELASLKYILEHELSELKQVLEQHGVQTLIGSSGSFDTILEMYLEGAKKEHVIGLSNDIPLHAFPGIHEWLLASTFEQRLKHPVIPTIRAEYMPLASYLIRYVLGLASFKKMVHSAYSLKEGAMKDILEKIEWPAEFPVDNDEETS
jgi:exopolyphosphatase/guanosine-5'-triphosphate,3'-diphosphate pyrophosphatase